MNGFSVVSVCSVLFIFEFIIFSSANNCGPSTLTAETGLAKYLTSPNFPDKYPVSLNCKWRIAAPAGYLVQLIFTDFDTYKGFSSCESSANSLNIYDSNSEFVLVGKYCGSTVPADVVSSGRYLYLTFSSTFYAGGKGFRIEYKAVKKPAEDFTVCSPFNSKSTNNKIDVKSSSSSQYIQSPLYPNKYPSNMVCTWHITASSNTKRIRLNITYINIGTVESPLDTCPYAGDPDRLVIYDGINTGGFFLKQVACERGLYDPPIYSAVTSTGRYMWVQFKTNNDNYFANMSKAGFQAKYIEFDPPITNPWLPTTPQDKEGYKVPLIISVSTIAGLIVVGCIIYRCKRSRTRRNATLPRTSQVTTIELQVGNYPPLPTPSAGSYPSQQPPSAIYPSQQPPSGSFPPLPTPAGSCPPQQPPSGSYPPQQPPSGSYPPQQPPTSGYPPQQPPSGSFPPLPTPAGGSYPSAGSYPPQQPPTGSY